MSKIITLTETEKTFLYSKMEYNKKQKAVEGTELYSLLKDNSKTEYTEEEYLKILKSLEFTFRTKLTEGKSLRGANSEVYTSILEKAKDFTFVKPKEVSTEEATETI